MDELIKKLLLTAVDRYGQQENIVTHTELERKWNRESYYAEVTVTDTSPLKLRTALIGLGRILEENMDELYWVSTIRVRSNDALLIMKVVNGNAYIAACAHEGVIMQHIAQKAVGILSSRLKLIS